MNKSHREMRLFVSSLSFKKIKLNEVKIFKYMQKVNRVGIENETEGVPEP